MRSNYRNFVLGNEKFRIPIKQIDNVKGRPTLLIDVELMSESLLRTETISSIIDTGAYYSEIDRTVMNQLGYLACPKNARPSRVHTGSSWIPGYITTLRQMRIHGVELNHLEVNVTDFDPRLGFSALIGLNLLQQFATVTIDWARGSIELTPKT